MKRRYFYIMSIVAAVGLVWAGLMAYRLNALKGEREELRASLSGTEGDYRSVLERVTVVEERLSEAEDRRAALEEEHDALTRKYRSLVEEKAEMTEALGSLVLELSGIAEELGGEEGLRGAERSQAEDGLLGLVRHEKARISIVIDRLGKLE